MNIFEAQKLLNLSEDDTPDSIKRKYRKLLFLYHPDYSSDKNTEKFLKLKQSYDFLMELFKSNSDASKLKDLIEKYLKLISSVMDTNKNKYYSSFKDIKKYFNNHNSESISDLKIPELKIYNVKLNDLPIFEVFLDFSGLLYFIFFTNRLKRKSTPLFNRASYDKRIKNAIVKEEELIEIAKSIKNYYPYYSYQIQCIIELVESIFTFLSFFKRIKNSKVLNYRSLFIKYAKLELLVYSILEQKFFLNIAYYKNENMHLLIDRLSEAREIIKYIEFKISTISFKNFGLNSIIQMEKNIKVIHKIVESIDIIISRSIPFPIKNSRVLTWFSDNL